MPGTGIFTNSAALFLSSLLFGADYLRLEPGNQWVYRCVGPTCEDTLAVVEVLAEEEAGGRRYAVLRSFHGELVWLRQEEGGVVWRLDRESDAEQLWYRFGAAEGEGYETKVDPCSPVALVQSRRAIYEGPAGRFSDVLHIRYVPGPCADAGLREEYFLAGTGLLRRTEVTIAGPRTYDLIYSRTGGRRIVAEPHVRFGVAVDRPVYVANLMPPVDPGRVVPRMTVRITLRNTTDQPVRLAFPTSQRYDLEIEDAKGNTVWRWSDGKVFLMIYGEEQFGPGERNYFEVVPLARRDGGPLAEGRYVLRAWLATEKPRAWSASVEFEVRHVH